MEILLQNVYSKLNSYIFLNGNALYQLKRTNCSFLSLYYTQNYYRLFDAEESNMYSKGKTVKLSNILFDIESFFIKLWNNILMKTMLTKFFIQKNYNTKIIT